MLYIFMLHTLLYCIGSYLTRPFIPHAIWWWVCTYHVLSDSALDDVSEIRLTQRLGDRVQIGLMQNSAA